MFRDIETGGVSFFCMHLGEIAIKFLLRLFWRIMFSYLCFLGESFLIWLFRRKPTILTRNFRQNNNNTNLYWFRLLFHYVKSIKRSIIQILICWHFNATYLIRTVTIVFMFIFLVRPYRRRKILLRRRLKCLCYWNPPCPQPKLNL